MKTASEMDYFSIVDLDTVRVELQNLYNKDKKVQIQQELWKLLKGSLC